MILLLGGTSETAPIAEALAVHDNDVLVSNYSDAPLSIGTHARIQGRFGPLTVADMKNLIEENGITCVVDATHPYAVQVTETALAVCRDKHLPYLRFERPSLKIDTEQVHDVSDHQEAARKACSLGKNILLTTGSRNLEPYTTEAKERQCKLIVRIIPCEKSISECCRYGISEANIIAKRGPFSIEDNQNVIAKHSIDVLVTKESGEAGGVEEKLEAAQRCNCEVVLVRRPVLDTTNVSYAIPGRLATLETCLQEKG